ncbi:MAG: metallophosphoesterase [Planctomycetota bacterium]
MFRVSAVMLFGLCLVCANAVAGAPESDIVMGPYVNHVDAASAKILWVSEAGAAPVQVAIEGGGQAFEAVSAPSQIAQREELLHVVELKGLRPFTRYEYRLPGGDEAPGGSFLTAPTEGVPFRFVAYGDTRTRPQWHARVGEAIAPERAAFVLCVGDLVEDGEQWDEWKPQFFDPAAPYLSNSVLWPIRGNHEGDGVFYRELLDLPGNELYYSFDFGDVHVIALDNYVDDRQAMYEWFEKDLSANDAKWTIVFYHEPTFNVAGHGSTWGRDDFLPLMERHGVDFVITGHSHLYERCLPIGPAGQKPIIHIVTGGGGAPLSSELPSPILAGGIGSGEAHFCVFDVDGSKLQMTVKRPNGSVLDELSLVKEDGKYQEEVMALALDTEEAKQVAHMFRNATVDFDAAPEPGTTVRATLVAPGLPPESTVTVRPPDAAAPWRFAERTQALADGPLAFDVTAPAALTREGFQMDPPVVVALDVEYGGRSYTAERLDLQLSAEFFKRTVPPPEPVDVPHQPLAVSLDGDLAEWADIRPMPFPFENKETSSFRLCWNDKGLYGAVVAVDDEVRGQAKDPWDADAALVFVEKDFGRSVTRSAYVGQYAFGPAPDKGPGAVHMTTFGRNWAPEPAVQCVWRPDAKGYVLEFLIPASVLAPARLEAGTMLGLDLSLQNGGEPVEQFYSTMFHHGWHNPFTWGAVRLAE